MTDEEVTILARLALLSMPPALLPRPFSQTEVEQIAKDAHGVAHRYRDRIAALETSQNLITAERDRTFALMLTRAETAEAALAPFLTGQHDPGQNYSDQSHLLLSVTLGDIRRARAALGADQ